jgi:hypothetical protein
LPIVLKLAMISLSSVFCFCQLGWSLQWSFTDQCVYLLIGLKLAMISLGCLLLPIGSETNCNGSLSDVCCYAPL